MIETSVDSAARRKAPRLEIDLPVELERGKGVTRDVSASGVFFETDEALAPGARIRFSLLVEHASPVPLRLQCEGQVVRVERHDGRLGVAATISTSRMTPLGGSPRKPLAAPLKGRSARPRPARLADQISA